MRASTDSRHLNEAVVDALFVGPVNYNLPVSGFHATVEPLPTDHTRRRSVVKGTPIVVSAGLAVNASIIGERPTGLGLYALNVIRALDGLGERLTVYTSRPEALTGLRARLHRVPPVVRPERGALGHALRLLWIQTALRARLRQTRPEALLNLMPEGLLRPAIPQVTTVLDLLPLRYPTEYPRQQYYFRYYVPAVLRSSRVVMAISDSTRRDVVEFYGLAPEKVRVAPCGYDADRFSPDGAAEKRGAPYALYVGNVMPHKNLHRLVEAFAMIAPRIPSELVIRGWGKWAHVQALAGRIEALGLAPCVDWRPYAEDDELVRLYRGARMLLLPSLAEGFGLTALEAMACGTPVIASNTSSLPEVVGEAGLLIDPHDPRALADTMARVFTDDSLAADLRARGLARARGFSWERTGRVIQAAIAEATKGPAR